MSLDRQHHFVGTTFDDANELACHLQTDHTTDTTGDLDRDNDLHEKLHQDHHR